MPSPALPGLFFCFAACVLLVFASISSPTWEKISYLNVRRGGGDDLHFGIFGYTGSETHVGYRISPSVIGYNDSKMNSSVWHNLTYTFILIPIAAGFSGLAVIFGLCAMRSRIADIFLSLTAALAALITLIAWVLEMVFFGVMRNRINHHSPGGYDATFGNANWLVLGALIALILGFCTGLFGICLPGYHRRRRDRVETY
ncbi:pali-domain-containing protein [Auriculariales sp. MPI-PUGE-AT-0066]|nr:pali-domain-containing protein [Auriculariales sp. MPI-PUGE-AT-0066]